MGENDVAKSCGVTGDGHVWVLGGSINQSLEEINLLTCPMLYPCTYTLMIDYLDDGCQAIDEFAMGEEYDAANLD